jgi:hypothetical protein
VESGSKPDYIIVDSTATRNDIIVIRNRCPLASVVLSEDERDVIEVQTAVQKDGTGSQEKRAVDILKDVNINMLSQNPVFLARVHLRRMDLTKVNQLLLDFDLKIIETQYIIGFLNTMLSKVDNSEELRKEQDKLATLRDSFQFYLHLMNKDTAEIEKMITNTELKQSDIATMSTLIAKVKPLFPDSDSQVVFTDFENKIWELQKGS